MLSDDDFARRNGGGAELGILVVVGHAPGKRCPGGAHARQVVVKIPAFEDAVIAKAEHEIALGNAGVCLEAKEPAVDLVEEARVVGDADVFIEGVSVGENVRLVAGLPGGRRDRRHLEDAGHVLLADRGEGLAEVCEVIASDLAGGNFLRRLIEEFLAAVKGVALFGAGDGDALVEGGHFSAAGESAGKFAGPGPQGGDVGGGIRGNEPLPVRREQSAVRRRMGIDEAGPRHVRLGRRLAHRGAAEADDIFMLTDELPGGCEILLQGLLAWEEQDDAFPVRLFHRLGADGAHQAAGASAEFAHHIAVGVDADGPAILKVSRGRRLSGRGDRRQILLQAVEAIGEPLVIGLGAGRPHGVARGAVVQGRAGNGAERQARGQDELEGQAGSQSMVDVHSKSLCDTQDAAAAEGSIVREAAPQRHPHGSLQRRAHRRHQRLLRGLIHDAGVGAVTAQVELGRRREIREVAVRLLRGDERLADGFLAQAPAVSAEGLARQAGDDALAQPHDKQRPAQRFPCAPCKVQPAP